MLNLGVNQQIHRSWLNKTKEIMFLWCVRGISKVKKGSEYKRRLNCSTFEHLHIKPRMFEIILWKFCNESSSKECFREVENYNKLIGRNGLCLKTIRTYYRKLKYLCGNLIKEILNRITLEGIVEIDECCITAKRRGLVGRFPGSQIWVFGIFSRDQKIFKVNLIPNRRSDTLFPIIRDNIAAYSTIISDEFSVYVTRGAVSRLMNHAFFGGMNYQQQWVNHSLGFVNPNNPQTYTNNIELR